MNFVKNVALMRSIACAVLTTSIAFTPVGVIAQATGNDQGGGKGWLTLLLLPQVKDALVGAFSTAFRSGASCVFSNLFSFMGAKENSECKPKVDPQTINNVPSNGTTSLTTASSPAESTVATATVTAVTPVQAEGLAKQPILTYIVKKLAGPEPNAQEIGVIANGQLEKDGSPNFKIRTGESFAIAFSTTVPGRVKLINTDVDTHVSESSVYETIPGSDNRLPRLHEGGILMTGKPGVESLDVEFTPCIAQTYAQDPRVLPFVNLLTPCTVETAIKSYKPAQASGKGGVANLGGKAMAFPLNANPGQPVAIAPSNYAKGDLLRFRILIDHEAK